MSRHSQAVSSTDEWANGRFYNALLESDAMFHGNIEQVVMYSSKVYYPLLEERIKTEQPNVVIICIEQLYPFPYKDIAEILSKYRHIRQFSWYQEELQNSRSWNCSRHRFRAAIPDGAALHYSSRKASASPATPVFINLHLEQQQILVWDTLTVYRVLLNDYRNRIARSS